eukprot:tig00000718_g3698.t1
MFVVSVPVLRAQQAPANAVQHQTRCLKPGLPAAIRSFAVRPLHRKLHRLQTAATTHTYALAGASASSSLLQTLPEPRSGGALSSEQLEFWKAHGWLSLEGFTSPTECEAMIARADELVEEFDPKEISVFTTKEQTRKSDTYFLESGDKVRFFFEEKAFDERGNLVQPKSTSINKIGHALHEHEPVFRRWGTSERIEEVLDALGFRRPLPVQSMYIFKQPLIGGEVVPHQDSTFLYTDPMSCVGLWLALEDATVENGCLWALPRETDTVELKRRFRRNPDAAGAAAGTAPATVFEPAQVTFDDWPQEEMVPLEVKRGTLVLLHGTMVHMSHENTSSKSRHAYAMHVVEGDGPAWARDNWLARDTPFLDLQQLRAL